MQYALAASTLLFATTVLSAHHEVQVGPGLTFNPNSISDVAEGDVVSVTFGEGHDLVQSTFAAPCEAMDNGIYSGPTPGQGDVFSFEVNSTDPMWFFCSVGRHCQGGMALAINPTEQNTIEAYQSAAEDTTSSAPSAQAAIGGTYDEIEQDDSDSNSTSSSASGTASESSSATGSSTGSSASASSTGDSGAVGVRVGMGLVAGVVAAGAAFAL